MNECVILRKADRWFLLCSEQLQNAELILSILKHEECFEGQLPGEPLSMLLELGWELQVADNAAA